jgi:hypothetical protein
MIHAQPAVNDSIETNLSAHASLSRAIAENADAAELYEAARSADTTETRLHYLQQALEIDPFHADAVAMWNTLQADRHLRGLQTHPSAHGTVHGAAALFTRFGWTVRVKLNRVAQLEKQTCVKPLKGLLAIMILSVPAMLVVMWCIRRARKARVHLQLEPDGSLSVIGSRTSRQVTTAAELVAVADSVADGLTLPWAAFAGIASVILWASILL